MNNSKLNLKRPPVFGDGFTPIMAKRNKVQDKRKPSSTISKPDLSDFKSGDSSSKAALRYGMTTSSLRKGTTSLDSDFSFEGPSRQSNLTTPRKGRQDRDVRMQDGRMQSPFRTDFDSESVRQRTMMTPIRARPLNFLLESNVRDKTPIQTSNSNEEITPRKTTPMRMPVFELPKDNSSEDRVFSGETAFVPFPKFDIGIPPGRKDKMKMVMDMKPPKVPDNDDMEVDDDVREMQRGLLLSPEKSSKRRNRFIRGGLADRAQQLMTRDSTSLVLWQKEHESFTSTSRTKPRFDLRVLVETVLQSNVLRNAQTPIARTVLAVCWVLDDQTASLTNDIEENIIHVVFRCDPKRSEPGDPSEIKDGSTILVWKPWFELQNPKLSSYGQSSPTDSSIYIDSPCILCSRFTVQSS